MRKKMLKVTALTLAAMMLLSSCGSTGKTTSADSGSSSKIENSAANTNAGGDKTITFWNLGTEGTDKKTYEIAIKQFEANTKSGYNLKDRFIDGALAQASYNGKIYAVPVSNIAVAGVYYNKTIFEKFGLEVPKTVSELEKVCDTLLENGITPFALANGSKWTGSMYFQLLAARKGGLEPFQKAAAGKGSFEDECFKYAGEKIQEWVKKGYFPDGFNSMSEDDGQAAALFYQEKAAMYLIGSWKTANFKTDTEDAGSDLYDRIGWFSFPAIDGSNADPSIMCGTLGDQFISFNCTGEKLDAAFEMATYLSSEETVKLMIDEGRIPPVKGIDDTISNPLSKDILNAANKASAVQLWYDQYLSPSVANAHLNGNQEVFGLTKTPEEANAMMQEAMKALNK